MGLWENRDSFWQVGPLARASPIQGKSSAAVLARPRFTGLAKKKDGDDEGGDGIGPPQAEQRVQPDTGEDRSESHQQAITPATEPRQRVARQNYYRADSRLRS